MHRLLHRYRSARFVFLWLFFVASLSFTGQRTPAVLSQSIPGSGSVPPPAPIRISEFMADNEAALQDNDGDYPDWIELFNAGDVAVDLEGWTLTDAPHRLDRWTIPAITIPAKGYRIIFASDKDRRDPAQELHTNFRLSAAGEFLALVDPNGLVASAYAPEYPPQFPDTSYGNDSAGNLRYFSVPTPGRDNDIAENLGPLISGVSHAPAALKPGEQLQVTARVEAAQHAVAQAKLVYRINFGREAEIAMRSIDGAGDGSGRYTATIPATAYRPGDMVRYAVRATDAAGYAARWPLFAAPGASPEYQGTMALDPTVTSSLPVFYWFSQDVGAANTDGGARGVVFYDGVLYDNVFIRLRGDTTTSLPKKSFKIIFNDGYHLRLLAEGQTVDEINVNSNVRDTSHLHQTLAWEAFRDAGTPYSLAFPVRVQRNGLFYGIFTLVEQPEAEYFARQELDWEGALYKINSNDLSANTNNIEKKTRTDENYDDLQALINGIHLSGAGRSNYLFDNVNIPAVINYLAVSTVIHDWDIVIKNYYLYRDTRGTGEWQYLPWDKDLTFGALAENDLNSHPLHGTQAHPLVYVESGTQRWNHLTDALLTTPEIRAMYLRRLRSVMDQLLHAATTPYDARYFETRIDELADQLAGDAELDAELWSSPQSFSAAISELKTAGIDARRRDLYEEHGPSAADGIIPAAQPAGARIFFGDVAIAPATIGANAEFFVLRNPNTYAVDISGWRISGDVTYTFQPGVVIPAGGKLFVAKDVRTFRSRTDGPRGGMGLFVQGGYEGSLAGRMGDLRLVDRSGTLIDRANLGFSVTSRVFLPVVNGPQ